MAIEEIHNKVFEFLGNQAKEENSDLVFRVRKTNRGNKLSKGYWFLGNENYLAIGFWPEINWKTRLPSISLMIDKDGGVYLLITTSDSEKKEEFVDKHLYKEIEGLSKNNENTWGKFYEGNNINEKIADFLYYDWYVINNIIMAFKSNNENCPFSLIDKDEFNNDIHKILLYKEERESILENAKKWNDSINAAKPRKIKNFEIYNYGPIDYCESSEIPRNTQWIFLTGENGTGKTSILKALATAIGYKRNEKKDSEKEAFRVNLDLWAESKELISIKRFENTDLTGKKLSVTGFAAYGAYRINNSIKSNAKTSLKKAGIFKSLFENEGRFLNLIDELNLTQEPKVKENLLEHQNEILELLERAMIKSGRVSIDENKQGDKLGFIFEEADKEGNLHPPVKLEKLSSGYLSIILMMNDMLIRLLKQQPKIIDIADLSGVVLIDEIDLHLHPNYQKHLVQQLSEAFPNIQFIVTTHSPIPLLGAPDNTVFLKVTRDKENGIALNRLKKLENEIDYLLPNTILTSDIFDFDLLEDIPERQMSKIYFEDNYDDIRRNKEIDKRLRTLDRSIFPDDLFKDEKKP